MTSQIEPVTARENRAVDGLALCAESIFHERIEDAQSLRERQAEYLESLPKDRDAAIVLALKYLEYGLESYPKGVEEALHLSAMLAEALRYSKVVDYDWEPDAAIYVAERIERALKKSVRALDRANDALRNPGRVEAFEKYRAS